ncbi:MAG TPA: exosome complex exonuclease Rrp41 [Candidatus Paceibacterota bacterium]|nr:exosome complex exonuclease Rrp41 [Candidatus Paceibacterota bacterium]
MAYTKRFDGRKFDETRKITAKVGVIPNADGSAMFAFGDTIAYAAVYGPKQLHPQHLQNPEKGLLRCNYSMMSFSVTDRIRPGPNKRSTEISKVTEWALNPAVLIDDYPNTVVDVHIIIPQADASTRCAGINAASLALAHAGIPMKELITSVSIGKMDKQLVVDVNKKEEDYEEGEGATDMAMSFLARSGKITHVQLDGKISVKELNEAIKLGREVSKKILEVQKAALKEIKESEDEN